MPNLKQIRDFYLAAYLITAGLKLISSERVDGGTLFSFIDDSRTQSAISDYYSMSTTVEPISYSGAIKSLKSIVHSNDITTKSESQENSYNVKQYSGSNRV